MDRPDLERQPGDLGELAGPVQRLVQVGDRDDGEAAQVLLALGERAVGHDDLAVALIRRTVAVLAGCSAPVKTQAPAASSSARHLPTFVHDGAEHLGRRRRDVWLVDAEQVLLHRMNLRVGGPRGRLVASYTNEPGQIDVLHSQPADRTFRGWLPSTYPTNGG